MSIKTIKNMECLIDHTYGKPFDVVVIFGDRTWCKKRCSRCNSVEYFYHVSHWRKDRWEVILDLSRESKLISEAIKQREDYEKKIGSCVKSWSS